MSRHPRLIFRIALSVLSVMIVFAAGCDRFDRSYGATQGRSGRESLNGFGGLRRAFEDADFASRGIGRLTERAKRTGTMVWIPRELMPIGTEVGQWFEKWLGQGNRTLVYVLPDSGSEAEYWRQATQLAPAKQRLEYRKRLATAINDTMVWRSNRLDSQFGRWFQSQPMIAAKAIGQTTGPWTFDPPSDEKSRPKMVEFSINGVSDDSDSTTTGPTYSATGPTGPSSSGNWYVRQVDTTQQELAWKPLLVTESGQTIVGEITCPEWPDSQIIVVAGGSLLTNFALTQPAGVQLASRIVQTSKANAGNHPVSVGFISTGASELPVSEREPGVPSLSGLEFFTVWPLSLVTVHAVILGFVVCLMLWPIFGKPRQRELPAHNDFSDHLDAVAALMQKAGDRSFARSRIAQYQQRVRGETSSEWADETSSTGDNAATAPPGQRIPD